MSERNEYGCNRNNPWPWRPEPCICGHDIGQHDYLGDNEVGGWGVCESRTCPCTYFDHQDYTDELFLERLGVAL